MTTNIIRFLYRNTWIWYLGSFLIPLFVSNFWVGFGYFMLLMSLHSVVHHEYYQTSKHTGAIIPSRPSSRIVPITGGEVVLPENNDDD